MVRAYRRRTEPIVYLQEFRLAQFYAYILGCIINVQWNLNVIKDSARTDIIRRYLIHVCGEDEWAKKNILDAISNKTRKTIKGDTRDRLPSLFVKRKAYPLFVPKELTTPPIFDLQIIEQLKIEMKLIKLKEQEKIMNDNENIIKTILPTEITEATKIVSVEEDSPNAPSVQLVLKDGKTVEDLTLANYREITGRRFRMTKEQKLVHKLTREQAFEEFKTKLLEEGV